MSVQPGFGVRRRISVDVACITVRQVKGKEVRLLFNPADHNQRFAKVRLPMPWGMAQRNKHLPRAALLRTHIVFDNRVSAIISAFIAQPFKYPLGCMALLARAGLIFCQPTIDLRNIRIKLGPLDRRCPPIPRRFGIRQHLRNTVSADPKIPSNLTPTQPVLKVSVTNLQIQIHGEYPQALPKQKGQKWPTFTPPATPQ